MAAEYVLSLLDPFDQSIAQPKLLDGSVDRSAGLKLKATGTFNLPATGADHYIVLFPGFSNCIVWGGNSTGPFFPTLFPSHVADSTNRGNIKQLRVVSAGLKLSLENSNDENEGYWEAVRIPLNQANLYLADAPSMQTGIFAAFAIADMSNYSTYQSGRLKDLERFLFKLNSVAPDHPMKRMTTALPVIGDCYDDFFDCVVIKMHGRVDAVTPSTIRYQAVCNQEVVFTEGTSLSRLESVNPMLPEVPVLLNKTRFILPGIQII